MIIEKKRERKKYSLPYSSILWFS